VFKQGTKKKHKPASQVFLIVVPGLSTELQKSISSMGDEPLADGGDKREREKEEWGCVLPRLTGDG